MQPFTYSALPSRVIFGTGTISQVPQEMKTLGCSNALIITGPHQASEGQLLLKRMGNLAVGVYSNATMHTPTDVAEDAIGFVRSLGADCVIALGGGSAIGLGKAIALRTDLPQIVLPTTYSGSEATPVVGQTENGLKTTQRTLKVLPEVIIYDTSLTLSLPTRITVTSGMNAIAHAVEALYSADANPIIDLYAQQGIKSIVKALPVLIDDTIKRDDAKTLEARSEALFGAWMCGTCLGAVGMSLHHKLCHILGGTFNLPHAETHTVILPHAVAYNTPFAPSAMAKLASSLDSPLVSPAQALFDLAKSLCAPTSLRELGMREEDLEQVADVAVRSPYPNPAPLEREKLLGLLKDAWAGNRPV